MLEPRNSLEEPGKERLSTVPENHTKSLRISVSQGSPQYLFTNSENPSFPRWLLCAFPACLSQSCPLLSCTGQFTVTELTLRCTFKTPLKLTYVAEVYHFRTLLSLMSFVKYCIKALLNIRGRLVGAPLPRDRLGLCCSQGQMHGMESTLSSLRRELVPRVPCLVPSGGLEVGQALTEPGREAQVGVMELAPSGEGLSQSCSPSHLP